MPGADVLFEFLWWLVIFVIFAAIILFAIKKVAQEWYTPARYIIGGAFILFLLWFARRLFTGGP